MTALSDIPGKGSFPRGVHPPEGKRFAENAAVTIPPSPAKVSIPLLQHTGSPAESLVKIRQEVVLGEPIGKSTGFISAGVHATINGKVGKQGVCTLPNGRHVPMIPITADGDQLEGRELWDDCFGGDWPTEGLDQYTHEQIAQAVSDAGIVGLGGAAFPTHVKFARNDAKPIDTILINGCECEPYLTADYRVMVEAPEPIITGALLAAHAAGAKNVVIAIEDNKPQAIEIMTRAAASTGVKIAKLHTKYPMGGEKQTILASLGRTVPTGGLPLDVGVVVINVGTSAAIARAVLRGKPLTHRVVTVSGAAITNPKNLLVPIGISYGELIDYCGGLRDNAARIVAGGPMMGFTLGDLNTPITKGTSGLTVLTSADVAHATETNCVRCGRCVDVCPLNLVPTKLALAARNEDWDLAKRYHLLACMECGCCAYGCPANLPLVQLMRVAKAKMPRD
ncbi:MAG: electron transport complex subunit RsxC [bacterium]|nr:electron transport complex subunit RsxC [bacterium]